MLRDPDQPLAASFSPPHPHLFGMDPTTALIESQARERALMVELNAAKIALVQSEGRESKALLREEAASVRRRQ